MGTWLPAEPDEKNWCAHGLSCRLRRGTDGRWFGYVGVSPEHPAYGMDYRDDALSEISATIHGGLQWSGQRTGSVLHWFGWDAAHDCDLPPKCDGGHMPYQAYRDFQFAVWQTERLAQRLRQSGECQPHGLHARPQADAATTAHRQP